MSWTNANCFIWCGRSTGCIFNRTTELSRAYQIRQARRIGHIMRLLTHLATSHTSPVVRCRSPTTGSWVRKRFCAEELPWFAIMSSAKYVVSWGGKKNFAGTYVKIPSQRCRMKAKDTQWCKNNNSQVPCQT